LAGAEEINKKYSAGILAIVFGHWWVHKFIMGISKSKGNYKCLVSTVIGYATMCFNKLVVLIVMASAIIGLQ